MQEENRTASPPGCLLPWIIAAVALVIYLITVSRWVTVQSLTVSAQVGGWDDNLPANSPLLYLVSRPLILLPSSILPLAGNLFTVLLASATLWTLSRCIQLLPQDRTHPQRIRGYADGRPLRTGLFWVPPVIGCALFGLQVTPWEHATSFSGEMLNALVFGTAVRALLEYRNNKNERWLDLMALLVGIGVTNNWGMIGFVPMFAGATLWIGGWENVKVKRVIRLLGIGCAGLVLYLVTPIVGTGRGGLPDSFGRALWAVIVTQKDFVVGIPKGRFLMLAAVMILPLGAAGIRWSSPRGSGLERMASFGALTLLQLSWLGGNIWMAFDGFFSPRALISTDGSYGALPLLTYHFCAALAVGYIAGYFVVLGTITPDRQWSRADMAGGLVHRVFAWLVIAGSAILPAALAVQNWKSIQIQNGPILSELAVNLLAPLPKTPAVVVTDDSLLHALLDAQIRRTPGAPTHLLIQTRRAPEARYRKHLFDVHGRDWPDLKNMVDLQENIGGAFLGLLTKAASSNAAFTLNPSTTFLNEPNYLVPAGAIYAFRPYQPGQIATPLISDTEAAAVTAYWSGQKEVLDHVAVGIADKKALAPRYAASFWGRTANTQGVRLQQGGRLDMASQLFAIARKIDPQNPSVLVNTAVNDLLRQRKPIDASVRRSIETLGVGIIEEFGAIDEPRFLEQLGSATLELGDPLVRASANAFLRARTLDPLSLDAALGYARACVSANEPKFALEAHAQAAALANRLKPTQAQRSQLFRVEATARMRSNDLPTAEQILLRATEEMPEDIPVLDLLSYVYSQMDKPENSLPYIERLIKLKPDDEALLQRRGFLSIQLGKTDEAIADFDRILSRHPDDLDALMNRGTCQLAAKRSDKAAADFESVLRRVPGAVDAQVGLAEVALQKKDKPGSIRQFEKVIASVAAGTSLHKKLTNRLAAIQAAP
jgi:tetratricopeptide (TPR) repeat protein